MSLANLAAEHEISVSHLQKLFKQVYGVPVYHYIREYRLEQAAMELVRSAKPVTQMRRASDMTMPSKFSESFKNGMARHRHVTVPMQSAWQTEQ